MLTLTYTLQTQTHVYHQSGFAPLHIAVDNGYTSVAKVLLNCGAAVNATDVVSHHEPHIISIATVVLLSRPADVD